MAGTGKREQTEEAFREIVRGIEGGDAAVTEAVRSELRKLTLPPRRKGPMPEGWYVIRVELLRGRDLEFDAPPGRDMLVSPQHTFRQFADAINACFARWDLSHLYAFQISNGTRIGTEYDEYADRQAARTKIGRREEGEVFEYEFDFGDGWTHRCTVIEVGARPEDVYGVMPKGPVAVWGWGSIPDQYGRMTPEG